MVILADFCFGPKVQAQATVFQAFRIAKIEEKLTTFMKLLGPGSDCGQLLKNIGINWQI